MVTAAIALAESLALAQVHWRVRRPAALVLAPLAQSVAAQA